MDRLEFEQFCANLDVCAALLRRVLDKCETGEWDPENWPDIVGAFAALAHALRLPEVTETAQFIHHLDQTVAELKDMARLCGVADD
jgi:hypothetical protein